MTRNRLLLPILLVVIAAVALIASTSGASKKAARPSVAAGSAISLKQTSVGKTVVDANGRTLYLFAADKPNVSTLSAAGRAVWPPFTASSRPAAGSGVAASQIGTTNTGNGGAQVTYNGHPLYYFVGDHKPGQVLGQGLNEFGARWYVLSAGGAAITTARPSANAGGSTSNSGASTPSGGLNYGY
jgi:predicted lipoprotein with Yx(FWY)xxD motif